MSAILDRAVTPTKEDSQLASEASPLVEVLAHGRHEVRVQFPDEAGASRVVSLPASALRLLVEILKEMAQGNAVTLIPIHKMLTTQEAADILNVSRPFLVRLLDDGKIPHRRLGSHRRILFQDLIEFMERTGVRREEALDELSREAQELGLGY